MRFVKPLDNQLLLKIFSNYTSIITIEDGTIRGGFGSAILEFAAVQKYAGSIRCLGIPDIFIEQGTIAELQRQYHIDAENLSRLIESIINPDR